MSHDPNTRQDVRWALAGTGKLAAQMVAEYGRAEGAEVVAVGSRTSERARAFADEHGLARAHGSYLDLVADPQVDAVHVLTPHPQHLEIALAAVAAGKAVLVEKAFTASPEGARELVAAARERGVFCMEGMWTRFLPVHRQLHHVIDQGLIGEVRSVQADLFALREFTPDDRLFDPDLGGGAMLDLGVYAVNVTVDLLGCGATLTGFHGTVYDNGADADSSLLLTWPGGESATLMVSLRSAGPGRLVVHGSQGFVEVVPRFHHSHRLVVHVAGQAPVPVDCPWRGEGYVHEIEAASRAIHDGLTEHPLNPLEDTLEVQRLMAEALDRLGLHPQDDRTPLT